MGLGHALPAHADPTIQQILAEREKSNPEAAQALDDFERSLRASLPFGSYHMALSATSAADGDVAFDRDDLCIDEEALDALMWQLIQPVRVNVIYTEDSCSATAPEDERSGIAIGCSNDEGDTFRYLATASGQPGNLDLTAAYAQYEQDGVQTMDTHITWTRSSDTCAPQDVEAAETKNR